MMMQSDDVPRGFMSYLASIFSPFALIHPLSPYLYLKQSSTCKSGLRQRNAVGHDDDDDAIASFSVTSKLIVALYHVL